MAIAASSAVAAADQAADEEAMRKAIEAYVVAFNQQDAKALAAFWSPEAVYINPLSDVQVTGREAIEEQFASIFAEEKGVKLEVVTESSELISPGVAVEHGSATLLRADSDPEQSAYTAIHVKRDGQWLLDRVTEEDLIEPPSHYENLKSLEWLVGSWTDEDDQAKVVTECNWTRNNNFLVRSFTVQIEDRIDLAGLQIIGWDPASSQIRSWVFDSDGGFGQGVWNAKGNRWYVQQSGVLPDGRASSEVNVITKLDDGTCTLQSINRTVDGELLPNVDEVKVVKE
jgi:uncharacterized protein (TIGR02246 family)